MDASRRSEAVRAALVRAAIEAYEDGGIRGLCGEGRFELAVDAMRALDLDAIELPAAEPRGPSATPTTEGAASVRRLVPEDAAALLALRLRGLREHPRSFLASEEEDRELGVEVFAERLSRPEGEAFVLGAEAGGALVGLVGVACEEREKVRHRATVWGVYIAPEHRGRGIARALILEAIDRARRAMPGVEVLSLSVDEQNGPAFALYRSLGFVAWGTEPDAFRAGGEPVDEVHMALRLR